MAIIALALVASVACSKDRSGPDASVGETPTSGQVATTIGTSTPTTAAQAVDGGAPPWAGEHLPASVPHESGAGCPGLSFADLGDGDAATPRHLEGLIGVAWDKPGVPGQNADGSPNPTSGRSAFGILANPGARRPNATWRFHLEWTDGSEAGYGYEGETDPSTDPNPLQTTKWLAQLHISDHDCAINVWSNLGRSHLELLLDNLRFVDD